ncbi:MAG: hypothetical protein AAF050_20240 [Cyanobacteria bacterium J06649_5]
MYYAQTPPYFLLAAGLFIAITSGLAFSAVLKDSIGEWYKNRSTRSISKMQGLDIKLPFAGICLGSCMFLASGMCIFGFILNCLRYGLPPCFAECSLGVVPAKEQFDCARKW